MSYFLYEYSDLNLFHTRVLVTDGKYAGMIVEFGSSNIVSHDGKHEFSFDYQIFKLPQQKTRVLSGLNKFLGKLLMDVIKDRNEDPEAQAKLDQAASAQGAVSRIPIDASFYPFKRNHIVETIHGTESF